MAIKIPNPIDDHTNINTRAGTIGSPAGVANKVYGGVPITQNASQWYGASIPGGAGLYWNFSSVQDFVANEKIYIASHQFNAPNRIQMDTKANQGINVRMYTNMSNYRLWTIGGNDTAFGVFRRAPTPFIIDPQAPGTVDTGTYNPASVASYGIAVRKFNLTGTLSNWNYIQNSVLMDTTKTGTDIPRLYGNVKMRDLHTEVFGDLYTNIQHVYTEAIGNTYYYMCPLVIGGASQGLGATSFDDEGVTVVSPDSNNPADPRFQLTNKSMRTYLDLQAGDTAVFSGTYLWGTEAPFDHDSNVGATVTYNNASFNNMGTFTIGSDVSGKAAFNLAAGNEVVLNGGNISGTIRGDARLLKETNLSNLTITGNLYVQTGLNSVLQFSNVTVQGLVFNDDAAHTLTINATNGSSLTAGDAGTAVGQTDVQNNVTVAVTVLDGTSNAAVQGAHVYLYKTSDKSQLLSDATDANGQVSITHNHSADVDFAGWVRKMDLSGVDYNQTDLNGNITSNGFSTTVKMSRYN